ncbi:MAG TPA: rhomboid family intramembrane serine protease [Rhizomicrobium sp.]
MAAAFGKRGIQVRSPQLPQAKAAVSLPAGYVQPAEARPVSGSLPVVRFPLVTIGLLVLLSVIFAFELRYSPAHGNSLSARTLATYGAIEGDLIWRSGEWWRLFTAPLLHASTSHLIGNAVVLGFVGFMLEPLIGPRWFAGLFAIGALGGAIASLCLNPADIPGVGASGAIMGVLGAAFICGSSARSGPKGRKMQTWALRLILPSLIPFAGDSHTDYGCHLGGLLSGLSTGVVLLLSWSRGEARPAFNNFGAGLGATGLAVGLLALALFAGKPGNAAVVANAASGLIPEAELPGDIDIGTDKAHDLLARYPHDPRAHLFRGFAFLSQDHDLADAEEQLRQALSTKNLLAAQLTPEFEKTVTVLLAITVAYENRPTEAKALGAPLCDFADSHLGSLHRMMQDKDICP